MREWLELSSDEICKELGLTPTNLYVQLHRPMMPFHRSCKEVTSLVITREDRTLPWRNRLALHMHMGMCKACPIFERQIFTMHNTMEQWRNHEKSSGADDRWRQAL